MKTTLAILISLLLLLFPLDVFAKNKLGYSIYLLNVYPDKFDIQTFDIESKVLRNPNTYLVSARSYKINLRNATLTAKVDDIVSLPIPATPVSTIKPTKLTVDLKSWHTVLVVETEYRKAGNLSYTTIYGMTENGYAVIQPRTIRKQ